MLIHGLKHDEISACKDEVRQLLVISRKISLTGYQVKYLRCKSTDKLEEWKKQCTKMSLPPNLTHLSRSCYISLVGTEDDIDEIEQEVYEIVGQEDQFHVEKFEITCPCHFLIIWKRRWAIVKEEMEETLRVVVEFSEKSDYRLEKEKGLDHVVSFTIFGKIEAVLACRRIIETSENGTVIEDSVHKPNNDRLDHPSVVSKELGLDQLLVWLQFRRHKVIITAPSSVPEDLQIAKMRVINFIQNTATKEEVINCSDEVACLVISAMSNQLAERHKVNIDVYIKSKPMLLRINGPSEGVATVKHLLQLEIDKLKREITSELFEVDAVLLPHLKSERFKQFAAELKRAHQVIISYSSAAHTPSVCSPYYSSPVRSHRSYVLKWYWLDDNGKFTPYDKEINSQITSSYRSAPQSCHKFFINGRSYNIDFASMMQINAVTRHRRQIKMERKYDIDEPNSSSCIQISVRGKHDALGLAIAKITSHCSSCLKTDKINISSCTDYLQASLKHIADQFQVRLSFQSTESRTVAIVTGVDSLVSESVASMQKEVINLMESRPQASDIQVSYPDEWQPQTKTVKLYDVPQYSGEWMRVAGKFQATLSTRVSTIKKIQRIQNKWIWQKYVQHKKMMAEKNGKDGVNEKELFHGTRNNDPGLIYDSEEGFDMRYSDKGLWGQANYFAENASYSNNYAHATSAGKQMFLVKVLTGETANIPQDRSLRMPPEKKQPGFISSLLSTNEVQLGKMKYDSVCGVTGGSTVYMTYDNLKAYPAYLITYHEVGFVPPVKKRSLFGIFKF